MSAEQTYNLEDIIDFGQSLEIGEYTGKATAVELAQTKKGDPKIVVTFEVTDGDQAGQTIDKQYLLLQGKTKNGATWCRGISELRADARALGVDASLPKSFTLGEARKAFAKVLATGKLKFAVSREPDKNDPEKTWPRVRVTGRHGAQAKVASDPLADLLG